MKNTAKRSKKARTTASGGDRSNGSVMAAVIEAYPAPVRRKLEAVRRLILDTARKTEGVGALEEALKWGQVSYLTSESKSGSTVRIDRVKSRWSSVASRASGKGFSQKTTGRYSVLISAT